MDNTNSTLIMVTDKGDSSVGIPPNVMEVRVDDELKDRLNKDDWDRLKWDLQSVFDKYIGESKSTVSDDYDHINEQVLNIADNLTVPQMKAMLYAMKNREIRSTTPHETRMNEYTIKRWEYYCG